MQDKIGIVLLLGLGAVAYTQTRQQTDKDIKAVDSLRQQVCYYSLFPYLFALFLCDAESF